jgi:hypothetical protein
VLVVEVASGCGSSSKTTSSESSNSAAVPSTSSTAPKQTTSGAQSGTTQPAQSATTSTGASTPTSIHRSSPPPSGRLLRRFTGYGNSQLGTIVVPSSSALLWSARHTPIQIFTSSGFMLVNSKAASGSVRLSRGSYRGVRVASHAGWLVELRSRSS